MNISRIVRAVLPILILALAAASVCRAEDFDCTQRNFGQEVGKYDGFVKYMEKDGVEYYNYTGACRLPEHQYTNPALSYAAVDGKLYAQIINGRASDFSGIGNVYIRAFGEPQKRAVEEDWMISSWNVEDGNYTIKLKVNPKAGLIKGVVYYNPLKDLLLKNKGFVEETK